MAASVRHPRMLVGDEILDFATGGKACFTIKNRLTGNRATYRVDAEGEGLDRSYRVSAFTGSDNTKKSSYTAMGVMDADGMWRARTEDDELTDLEAAYEAARNAGKANPWIRGFLRNVRKYRANGWALTPKMRKRLGIEKRRYKVAGHVTDDVQLKAFPWMWARLTNGLDLPEVIEVWHEGSCCHCYKKLTVPASLELGKGWDCAKARGEEAEWKRLDTLLGRDLDAYGRKLAARHTSESA